MEESRKKSPQLNVSQKKCFKTDTLLKFNGVIVRKKAIPVYNTIQSIQLENVKFGTHIDQIILTKGTINCVHYFQVGEGSIKVIGYNENMLNTSVKLSFFMFKSVYFFGEYHFSGYNEVRNIQIAKTILKKYNITENKGELNFYIEDESGSILYFCDDGFSLSIKYFNPALCNSYPHLHMFFHGKFESNQKLSDESLDNALKRKF